MKLLYERYDLAMVEVEKKVRIPKHLVYPGTYIRNSEGYWYLLDSRCERMNRIRYKDMSRYLESLFTKIDRR